MMDSRTVLIIFLTTILLCCLSVAGFLYFQLHGNSLQTVVLPALSRPTAARTPAPKEPTQIEITVFFLSEDESRLEAEERTVFSSDTITERVRKALEELIRGSLFPNRVKPIPSGTQLQSVFWSEPEGRITVSFSDELIQGNPGHALSEWATLYSIVDTVADQSPAIKEVQILKNGEIINSGYTLWDWSLPFLPDRTYVAPPVKTTQ